MQLRNKRKMKKPNSIIFIFALYVMVQMGFGMQWVCLCFFILKFSPHPFEDFSVPILFIKILNLNEQRVFLKMYTTLYLR